MKLFIKLFLLLVVTSFSVAIVSAQSPPAPVIPTKVIGKARIYEFKTKTKVESVFLKRNNIQIIRATFEVPSDQAGAKPKGFQFFYQSWSDNGFKYKDNRQVAIILDKKGTAQGEAKLITASCFNPRKEKECYEVLISPLLPFADFEAMLKAKDVKIQFGKTVFELTPEEKDGLRDLQRTLDK
ncbi:MAG TPA: hypothetical protein VGW12_10445 [Pyrinomonadaceae bacterium]|nr:hypothetical protein [Pyrinomonadaceae bacterium]